MSPLALIEAHRVLAGAVAWAILSAGVDCLPAPAKVMGSPWYAAAYRFAHLAAANLKTAVTGVKK